MPLNQGDVDESEIDRVIGAIADFLPVAAAIRNTFGL